ncbi:MAG TPA: alginate lyase family protein [Asticcacaulis sp.]|nr:alginate lyase family protein [Asticcacaulis sp.]
MATLRRVSGFAGLFLAIALPAIANAAPQCRGEDGYAADFGGRRTVFLRPDALSRIKADRIRDPVLAKTYAVVIADADAALQHASYSVMDKARVPPSGDKHDYMSIGPYWWPDPAKSDGLPYIRRDGETNPERLNDVYDNARMGRFSHDVSVLALAYYYGGDERYARKAAELLRAWFLDPATRMNPNLDFAQGVPGVSNGRPTGIIDTTSLLPVVEAIGLLAPSPALTAADRKGLEAWFGDYVTWLVDSEGGKGEDAAENNHGIWYDAQLSRFALFARKPDVARKVVEAFARRRIDLEFAADGTLPLEIARTRSLHYSIYALQAAYDVASVADCLGTDLWNYVNPKGGGLKLATLYLAGFSGHVKDWPYPDLKPGEDELNDLLARARIEWPQARLPAGSVPGLVPDDYLPQVVKISP